MSKPKTKTPTVKDFLGPPPGKTTPKAPKVSDFLGAPPKAGTWLGGVAEAAANIGSSVVSMPAAGLAGLVDDALQKAGVSHVDPAKVVQHVESKFTYQPKTQRGKEISHVINVPFELLGKAGDAAGNYVLKKTGSPAAATAVKTVITGAPALLGLKDLGGAPAEDAAAESAASPGTDHAQPKPEAPTAAPEAPKAEPAIAPEPIQAPNGHTFHGGDTVTVDGLPGVWTITKPNKDGTAAWLMNERGDVREAGSALLQPIEATPTPQAATVEQPAQPDVVTHSKALVTGKFFPD